MRANFRRRRGRLHGQSGTTMIELMMAGFIMVVGFLGLMVLITAAIATNNRNKMDTNATLAAQMVYEEVRSSIVTGSPLTVTDCAGNTWTIGLGSTTVGATAGAPLSGATIDYSAAIVSSYQMDYNVCTASGRRATYDVRWNIKTLTDGVSHITVGSRPKGASSDLKFFALPVTLRGIAGS